MSNENLVTINSKIVRDPEIIFHAMDDETVMMSLEKGEYYCLPPIGTQIWQILETPRQVSELCDLLVSDFDVTREQCEKDVLFFLNQMAEKEIVKLVNS